MVREVPKAWGKEVIFADTALYCGKLLCFDKAGNKILQAGYFEAN